MVLLLFSASTPSAIPHAGRDRLALTGNRELPQLFQQFKDPTFDPRSVVARLKNDTELSSIPCPGIFSLIAEMLLDRQEHDDAEDILTVAIERFPQDLRLLQLRGLLHSRLGELREAVEWLEPLQARYPDDSETRSILAGVLKRMWWADRAKTTSLKRSHELYGESWKRSRKTNVYLGTNAATTALWLDGNSTRSSKLAEEVSECLKKRDALSSRSWPARDRSANYWGSISLAEAEVLLGSYREAQTRYLAAFARHPERKQNIVDTRQQLGIILEKLTGSDDVDAFLNSTPPNSLTESYPG
jgi:tetratricopeptide (TPR) repeat protein